MWSHDVIAQSVNLASDLKMGQYLKIPPRAMFLTQLWGTLLGAMINYGTRQGSHPFCVYLSYAGTF